MSVREIEEHLNQQEMSLDDFVTSTDRLLAAAANSEKPDLLAEIVQRTARLAGVDSGVAAEFVFGRISRQLEKAAHDTESDR